MTRYGYARVSSVDQNLSRQVEALIGAGVAYERIYKDKETGSRDGDRKEQKRLFKRMRRGDGHTGGRPRTPEARLNAAVRLYLAHETTVAKICEGTGVSRSTLYRTLAERGLVGVER